MQTALFSSIHMTNSSKETILELGLQSSFLAVGKPWSNFSQHDSFWSLKFTVLQTFSYTVLSPSLYATCSTQNFTSYFSSDKGKYKQNTTTLIALPSDSLPWISILVYAWQLWNQGFKQEKSLYCSWHYSEDSNHHFNVPLQILHYRLHLLIFTRKKLRA